MAAIKVFGAKGLVTGAEGMLDAIDYADLSDQDMALTVILTGAAAVFYVHAFDASSALDESSPDVIAPDNVSTNTGRWILCGTTAGIGTFTELNATGGTSDGALERVTIGVTTPRAGRFTTLAASSDPLDADGVGDRAFNDARYALEANNLDDLADAATARTNLGLGTISTQAADNVNIDGGTIDDVEYVEAGGSTAGADGYLKVTSVTDAAVFEIIADDDNPNCVFGTSTDNSVHIMVNNVRNAAFSSSYFRPAVNNQKSLGDASHLWTVVYATNGTIQTSTAKLKAGIKETPLGLDFVLALQPKEYRWADHEVPAEVDIKGAVKKPAYIKKHTNKHHGFVAEDVAAVMQEKQVEFAGLATIDGEPSGLNYAEFTAPMVKAIQELSAQKDTLEARIAALEKK